MNLEMAGELLSYNTWANRKMLEAVSHLDPQQSTRELGGSYPSVRSTLTHMLWAEWLWLERWQEFSPMDLFDPGSFPSVESVNDRWLEVQGGQAAFVGALTGERLQRVGRYMNRKGETWEYVLWRQLQHAFNHSTYHRGQVTNMLRQLGARPASTDYLVYRDERR
jgi:uncharacterized damage-inducible protein DinB